MKRFDSAKWIIENKHGKSIYEDDQVHGSTKATGLSSIDPQTADATIGIQDYGGSNGIQVAFDESYLDSNLMGTLNVLEASRKAKIKKFIYAASASCYGIPKEYPTNEKSKIDTQYPYALTKFMGEETVIHWAKVY